jgi:hypothetical protein
MTTLATATAINTDMQPDEFYFQLNFEEILLKDIARTEAALTYPIHSWTALSDFDLATDSWIEMVQQAYGGQHPDARLEASIAKLAKLVNEVADRCADLRKDAKVLSSAWSQAAQTYLSSTGRNIGYNDRQVLMQTSRDLGVDFGIQLLLEQSLVQQEPNGNRLHKVPRWLAEIVSDSDREYRRFAGQQLVIETVPVPSNDDETQLLLAMFESMTLSRAAKAARLLSHTW